MNALERFRNTAQRLALLLLVTMTVALFTTSPAWAKPKKQEKEAPPSKSYVVPYMVVLAMIGVGLMAVCRPANRLEKPDDRMQKDED
jgi:hypothetical protein